MYRLNPPPPRVSSRAKRPRVGDMQMYTPHCGHISYMYTLCVYTHASLDFIQGVVITNGPVEPFVTRIKIK